MSTRQRLDRYLQWGAIIIALVLLVACTSAPTPTRAPFTPAPATQAPSAAVSFKQDVLPIFQARCTAGCHSGGSPRAGLNLETYAGVMKGGAGGAAVKPKDLDGSILVRRVQNDTMPPGANKLTPEQKRKIADWVTAGAPDN